MEKGREEGIEQGLQQGAQQGARQEGQQMVLDALEERFGELPETVSDTIRQIQDQEQLRLLLRQAIRSTSLEEFQSSLNGN
jgi:flagellar biosynthesis/type III secretory pathway protein FliH